MNTTILDCLFPLEGWVESQKFLQKTRYWLKLQGRGLTKYENQGDTVPHKGKVTVLENREWEVSALPKEFGIKLVPSKKAIWTRMKRKLNCTFLITRREKCGLLD